MKKTAEELKQRMESLERFSFPTYSELPGIELYMEQVLTYVNEVLSTLTKEDQAALTSFMVNNYVKAKIIKEPNKKRYGREQLGYLIAICTLKQILPMTDISFLIEMDERVSADKAYLYQFWSNLETDGIHEGTRRLGKNIETLLKLHARETQRKGREIADQKLRDSLGLLALRLSINAQVNKMLSEAILASLQESLPEESSDKTKKKSSKIKGKGEKK